MFVSPKKYNFELKWIVPEPDCRWFQIKFLLYEEMNYLRTNLRCWKDRNKFYSVFRTLVIFDCSSKPINSLLMEFYSTLNLIRSQILVQLDQCSFLRWTNQMMETSYFELNT